MCHEPWKVVVDVAVANCTGVYSGIYRLVTIATSPNISILEHTSDSKHVTSNVVAAVYWGVMSVAPLGLKRWILPKMLTGFGQVCGGLLRSWSAA